MRTCAILLTFSITFGEAAAQHPRLHAPDSLTYGVAPGILISGLPRGDSATLVAWRRILRRDAQKTETLTVRSYGTFIGTDKNVEVDGSRPIHGTWDEPDPFGFEWSMADARTLASARTSPSIVPGQIFLGLEYRGKAADSVVLGLRRSLPGIRGRWVEGDGFAGSFAAPKEPGRHPALIVLHGSEGGDSLTARYMAESFAAHGFSTLALVYFSWGNVVHGVPGGLVNIPLEMLDHARDWMGSQNAADTSHTMLWGGSKGAEFALVAASRRSWPTAVVACVPSDVVWTGFGGAPAADGRLSSWSDKGEPLAYVPYDRYEDALSGKMTARMVHDRSRAAFADSVAAARIPLERSHARFLLLGSDRDEVWNSGQMIRNIESVLNSQHGKPALQARVFAQAGHGICGMAMTPWVSVATNLPTDTPPDPHATAIAQSKSWRLSLEFLEQSAQRLKPSRR